MSQVPQVPRGRPLAIEIEIAIFSNSDNDPPISDDETLFALLPISTSIDQIVLDGVKICDRPLLENFANSREASKMIQDLELAGSSVTTDRSSFLYRKPEDRNGRNEDRIYTKI